MEKMARTHFFNAATGKYEFNGWADAIGVRATSKTEMPEKGHWEVLNNDAYRSFTAAMSMQCWGLTSRCCN